MFSKIQYISQGRTREEQLKNITSVLRGGCQWVQLRFKNASPEDFIATAEAAKKICHEYNATFIINDQVEIARKIDADGVHLGLTDTSIHEARTILGYDKIIGGTANTLEDVLQRINERCDYIGLGPFRFTSTKEKLSPVLGLEGFTSIMESLSFSGHRIPVYAIGGIVPEDIEPILQTGIHGIALSGILSGHDDTSEIIKQLNQKTHANA